MVCVGVGIKRVAFLPIDLGWKDLVSGLGTKYTES